MGGGRSKTKGFIKTKSLKGGVYGVEFARGMREKVRGEYGFSSLMKQKTKS